METPHAHMHVCILHIVHNHILKYIQQIIDIFRIQLLQHQDFPLDSQLKGWDAGMISIGFLTFLRQLTSPMTEHIRPLGCRGKKILLTVRRGVFFLVDNCRMVRLSVTRIKTEEGSIKSSLLAHCSPDGNSCEKCDVVSLTSKSFFQEN